MAKSYCLLPATEALGFGGRIALVALVALLFSSTVPRADEAVARYALLIGVSDYPRIDTRYRLEGPRNDVELMRQVLRTHGFPEQHIRVLADGVPGAGTPTRAAVLNELDRLATTTEDGSFVYLHFSGHGSRQPCPAASPQCEPDGMDELILPYDAANWDRSLGTVEQAILDDELRVAIDAIRSDGTFVWAVFDSCHSGSVTRAFTPRDERERRIPENALGVPTPPLSAVRGALEPYSHGRGPEDTVLEATRVAPENLGGLVTFFASQPYQSTFEKRLPAYSPDAKPHGLFTYALASILSETPNISYRQLAQAILHRYAETGTIWPTPLFPEGNLDAPVFGGSGRPAVRQWPLLKQGRNLILGAGRLQGIDKETILAVVRSPAAESGQTIGYVEVTDARTLESQVRPFATADKPALAPVLFPRHSYARLERASLSLELTVSRPPPSRDPQDEHIRGMLTRASESSSRGDFTVKVRWVDADEPADVRLFIKDQQLWVLPPSAELIPAGPGKTPVTALGQSDDQVLARLQQILRPVAKGTNLLRLASLGLSAPRTVPLSTTIEVRRRDGTEFVLRPEDVPVLRDGDHVLVKLSNQGESPIDATVLFLDSRYRIFAVFPLPGDTNRIPQGKAAEIPMVIVTSGSTGEDIAVGRERLIVIATEGRGQSRADFTFVAQDRLPTTRGSSGESGYGDFYNLLKLAGFSQLTTRSALPVDNRSMDRVKFDIFTWDSVAEPQHDGSSARGPDDPVPQPQRAE